MFKTVVDSASAGLAWWRLARAGAHARVAPSARRLALLAWALPPNSNAGVFRPLSFLQYGPAAGWTIDAFHGHAPAGQRQHGEELLARVPTSVRLHEVPASGRRPSWRLFPRIDGGFVDALDYADHCIGTLRDTPPSVVLASGPPFFVFVAALFVARHFGAQLVLDYRDEWSECPFDFVSHGPDDRAWERRCLAQANLVLFTTQSHLQHQLQVFPELDAARCALLPNGWEEGDFSATTDGQSVSRPNDEQRVLAHVGNLAGHTPPDAFLRELEALVAAEPMWRTRLRVVLVGRRSPQAEAAIKAFPFPDMLDVIDHVSKPEANRRMQQADALLLISVPDLARYLPGKLFDYVAAGRPVLVHGAEGESSRLVDALGIGVRHAPRPDGSTLGQSLHALFALPGTARKSAVVDWLADHRRSTLARRVFDMLDELLASTRTAP
jgi:hypothetical protein